MMQILFLLLLVLASSCFHGSNGAKILAVFPLPATSHMTVNSALVRELAHRGHQVTVISPFPEKKPVPNLTDISIEKLSLQELLNDSVANSPNPFDMEDMNYFAKVLMIWQVGSLVCENFLQKPQIQKIIHSSDQQFDLIILEVFFIDCLLGFAHKFKAPVVQVCSFGGTEYMGDLVGNPSPYSYVPDVFTEYSDRMNFKERIFNTLCQTFQQLIRKFYFIPKQEAIMRKYFNHTTNVPSIAELERSTALVLLNHHYSISYAKPLMPNIVQVGGMHIKSPNKLPEDIEKFLNEAPEGVIFFSMGSNLKSSEMPESKVKAFVEVFSKLKQRVLWKWEEDTIPGQSKNLKLGKWLPQSDILAHPNLRLFITHGGLLSTQETIHRGVPVIGIPIYGDQKLNMARTAATGCGIRIDYINVTVETLSSAIKEVLENPRYRENAQRMSRIYRDQLHTPLEQAVFWTEYVIRHKGAPHMRSAALDLKWYQYFLLDVIAVLLITVISVLLVILLIVKTVFRLLCGSKKPRKPRKKTD